jgi:hypothetical protein
MTKTSDKPKYFCWERTVGNRWMPVFYTESPRVSSEGSGKESVPIRSTIHEVPQYMSMTEAMIAHPMPKVE